LPNVVARLVGGMKRQKGFADSGAGVGGVWVQTGVDVSIATCVIASFQDRRSFQQVVLLSGDSDLYPCVQYCNSSRRNHAGGLSSGSSPLSFPVDVDGSAGGATAASAAPLLLPPPPVRVCGTTHTMSKVFGQHQDLSDFLPRILLDEPTHIREAHHETGSHQKTIRNRVAHFFC